MRVDSTIAADNNTNTQQWFSKLRRVYELVARVINGNVSFGDGTVADNVHGAWETVVTPPVADTDFTVNHGLGQPAVGYMVMTADKAVSIYTSPTANPGPNNQLILRASASSASVRLFIL